MINAFAILLTGFSLFGGVTIAFGFSASEFYKEHMRARVYGVMFLVALGGLQFGHFLVLYTGLVVVQSSVYLALLFTVAPLFYLFSEPVLKGRDETLWRQLLHFIPAVFSPLLTAEIAFPLAFTLGALYLIKLAQNVYRLRQKRDRFALEIVLLGVVFLIAVLVLGLVVFLPALTGTLFYALYSIAIGLGFLLASIALAVAPKLPVKVAEIARETYAVSTLENVDCDALIARLDHIMVQQKLSQHSALTLNQVATQLTISSHQLSELLNQRMGKNFARYVRECRIDAAKSMLLETPSASVLSVGMSVGFSSQSAFYDAFHEIEGTTPAKHRKLAKLSK